MKKVLLVDAYSMISRAFYGLPILTTKDGKHTNALLGFFNILFKVIEEEKVDHIVVCFDVKKPTFRHKLYPEYKGQRKPMPDELHEQVPYVKKMLELMGIKQIEFEGYEADDLVGTFAKRFADDKSNEKVESIILTGDRDLLQICDKNIKVRLMKTVNKKSEVLEYYPDDVLRDYGVTPKQFIDVKALQGDTSDNVPGVKGIGEKAAPEIIKQYDTVENAILHASEITKKSIAKNLEEQKDLALLCKKLVTIDTNVPYDLSFEETEANNMFNENVFNFVQQYELKSLYPKFEKKGVDISNIIFDESKLKIVEDEFMADNIFKDALSEEYVGFYKNALVLSKDRIYEFNNIDILSLIRKYKNIKFVTINLKSSLSLFNEEDESITKEIDDVSVISYLNNPIVNNYDFSKLNISHINAYHAYVAFTNFKEELSKLKCNKETELYYNVEKPLIHCLYNMEKLGIKVDREKLKVVSNFLAEKLEELTKSIYILAGTQFNINSPKQLGEVLFEKLKLPNGKKTKTGYSTSADVLEKLIDEHEIVPKLLEYRTYYKLLTTYATGLENYVKEDGRIHSTFNQTVTATGRISSDSPNMQNIPVKTELGRKFREVFIPEEGYTFVDADYSQVELRILASLSGDENLINAYKSSKDIHTTTASQVFDVPIDKVTKEMRSNAKAVNFGIVYGISAFGLSEGLSISRQKAKEYIDKYFETYPKVKKYLDDTVNFAKENGYVKTYYGRIRPIPELKSSNFMLRSFGERIAMNSPIQGTAADIMKIAMVNVDKAIKENKLKSRVVLQVHDEILVETKIGEEDIISKILHDSMISASDLIVPLEVSIEKGDNWDEAH